MRTDYSSSIPATQEVFLTSSQSALDSVYASFADYETQIYGGCDPEPCWGDNEAEPFEFDDGADPRDDYDYCLHNHIPFRQLCKPIPGFEREVSLFEYMSLPNPGQAVMRTPIPQPLRWAVFRRDHYTCMECGCEHDLTVDHIIPVARGGPTSSWNLRTLCRPCNSRKGKN